MAPDAPPPRPGTVAYLTDVEGLWNKLESFTRDNPCVTLDPRGRLEVREGATFVFGGDAIDRGPDARRIVATLLDLKRRQPDRTVLLAGNRDINKMRLTRELGGHPPARAPTDVRALPRAQLLRWIFDHTMGARSAFEFRRDELRTYGLPSGDEDVAQSFLDDLGPAGPLGEYLAVCQLAWRQGSSLFVHGNVTAENLGRVPHLDRTLDDVDEWATALNAWYRSQVAAWRDGPADPNGPDGASPGAALIAYQAPLPKTRHNQASVVYARPTDDTGNPFLPPPGVIAALQRQGIRRLLVGHTPSGDAPAVLRAEGFEQILADNSYGRVELGSRVIIEDDAIRVTGRTHLDDGTQAEVGFDLTLDEASPLGQRDVDTGQLVKAGLASGDYLLFRALPENRVEQLAVSPHALRQRRLAPPLTDPSR